MNCYYNEINSAQLKRDLERSGFKVHHIDENISEIRSVASISMEETAASIGLNRDEDLFIELDTGTVISN